MFNKNYSLQHIAPGMPKVRHLIRATPGSIRKGWRLLTNMAVYQMVIRYRNAAGFYG
jgi:hypothetical protein